MRTRRRARPQVEHLETRWVPATVQFVSGNLFIRPGTGELALSLAVTQTAPNKFSVTDHGAPLGTYGPVSGLNITGGNGADSVTVDVNGMAYTGSLTANTGNGNDTINLTDGAGTGSLGGSVSLSSTFGNTLFNINSTGANALAVGGRVQITHQSGPSTASFGNAGGVTQVGGDITVAGVRTVQLGNGQNDIYSGNVSVSLFNNPGPLVFQEGPLVAGTDVVSIGKSLSISTSAGNDTVTLSGLTIGGNLGITLGNATTAVGNAVTFGNSPLTITTVDGNFTYTGGSGADTLFVGSTLYHGDVSLNVGDGADVIDLTPFPTQQTAIDGSLTVQAGNGDIIFNGSSATIGGNATFNLGNGNDTVTLGNAPGGRLFWTSGSGNDSVTFGNDSSVGGQTWNVQMHFGSGSDTLTLADSTSGAPGITPATPDSLTGLVDMGGPPGGNSFDPTGSTGTGSWVIVQPFTLQNV
jgi:hypothetical protein